MHDVQMPVKKMKYVLAIFLVFMALRPAQAVELPDWVIGPWCGHLAGAEPLVVYDEIEEQIHPNYNTDILLRKSDDSDPYCGHHGGTQFWQRDGKSGYTSGRFDEDQRFCNIDKIEKTGPGIYLLRAICHEAEQGDETELLEIWRYKSILIMRDMPES